MRIIQSRNSLWCCSRMEKFFDQFTIDDDEELMFELQASLEALSISFLRKTKKIGL